VSLEKRKLMPGKQTSNEKQIKIEKFTGARKRVAAILGAYSLIFNFSLDYFLSGTQKTELGGKGHCESRVCCPRTQCTDFLPQWFSKP